MTNEEVKDILARCQQGLPLPNEPIKLVEILAAEILERPTWDEASDFFDSD